jgi:hypothetical protein
MRVPSHAMHTMHTEIILTHTSIHRYTNCPLNKILKMLFLKFMPFEEPIFISHSRYI